MQTIAYIAHMFINISIENRRLVIWVVYYIHPHSEALKAP